MAIVHELVRELISFIFLYGFDLGMDISVLFEAQQSYIAYKRFLDNSDDTSVNNNESKQITFVQVVLGTKMTTRRRSNLMVRHS